MRCWLIEAWRYGSDAPMWWGRDTSRGEEAWRGHGWVKSPQLAIRYARQVDAETAMMHHDILGFHDRGWIAEVRATEHIWDDGPEVQEWWIIESRLGYATSRMWWGTDGEWVDNHGRAMRFARREDAEAAIGATRIAPISCMGDAFATRIVE